MKLQPEQVKEIREAIAAQTRIVENSGMVFSAVKFFDSENEFYTEARASGYNIPGRIRFCMISPGRIVNDAPYAQQDKIILRYKINVFHSYYADKVGEANNSTDIFESFTVNLRNRLLAAEEITEYAEIRQVTQTENIEDAKNEYLTGTYGYYTDFFVDVDVPGCC